MSELSAQEVGAVNSPRIRAAMTRDELLSLRNKMVGQRSQRGLVQLDAEIRWRDINGYA